MIDTITVNTAAADIFDRLARPNAPRGRIERLEFAEDLAIRHALCHADDNVSDPRYLDMRDAIISAVAERV